MEHRTFRKFHEERTNEKKKEKKMHCQGESDRDVNKVQTFARQSVWQISMFCQTYSNLVDLQEHVQRFYFVCFTVKYTLLPNPKTACIFPISDIYRILVGFIPKFKRQRLYPKVGNKITDVKKSRFLRQCICWHKVWHEVQFSICPVWSESSLSNEESLGP